jgi:hypothetical protein
MPRPVRATYDDAAVVESASDALGALAQVDQEMRALEVRKVLLIGAAQRHGATWGQIGSALKVSRQAAWEKHRDQVRALFEATGDRATASEEEALLSAASVLREIRRRRCK